MLAGAVLFIQQGLIAFKSYLIHKQRIGMMHTLLCCFSGLYCFVYYNGLTFNYHGNGNVIFGLSFIFATAAYCIYLFIIEEFLNIRSKIILVAKYIFLFAISFYTLDIVYYAVTGNTFAFTPTSTYKTALGYSVNPGYTVSNSCRFISALSMLGVFCSAPAIFYYLRKKTPHEYLLQIGITISFLASLNDLVMGMGIFFYLFPLTLFTNAFEIFRFGSHFQKEAFRKVQVLTGELNRIAKAAQVGTIASSITHDIRTPLTVILGHSQKIERKSDNAEIDKSAKLIQKQCKRIHAIINLYTGLMYTDKKIQKYDVKVKDVIEDVVELTSKALDESTINLILDVEDTKITGERNILTLAITNLITNSYQAIVEKNYSDRWIKLIVKENEISVIDSGTGISDDIAENVFDMQFTTKKQGEGTGLGLGIVRELLSSIDLSIVLDKSSQNTKFTISV